MGSGVSQTPKIKERIVDYDKIELSNLSRQFIYSEEDIGKLKVEAAKEKLQKINRNVMIEAYNMKVNNASELNSIISEADIVINSIDTPPIQAARWVNYACMRNNKVLIQGGLVANELVLDVFSKETGCYDCFLLSAIKNDSDFAEQLRYVLSTEFKNVNTSFAPNVSMLTGILTSEIAKIITGYEERLVNDSCMAFNVKDFSKKFINNHNRIVKCPTCGKMNVHNEPVDIEQLIKIASEL